MGLAPGGLRQGSKEGARRLGGWAEAGRRLGGGWLEAGRMRDKPPGAQEQGQRTWLRGGRCIPSGSRPAWTPRRPHPLSTPDTRSGREPQDARQLVVEPGREVTPRGRRGGNRTPLPPGHCWPFTGAGAGLPRAPWAGPVGQEPLGSPRCGSEGEGSVSAGWRPCFRGGLRAPPGGRLRRARAGRRLNRRCWGEGSGRSGSGLERALSLHPSFCPSVTVHCLSVHPSMPPSTRHPCVHPASLPPSPPPPHRPSLRLEPEPPRTPADLWGVSAVAGS